MNDIQNFMGKQFNPRRFVLRERYRFWCDLKQKPGETLQELFSRIQHNAVICDFQSIKDPLHEALRTRFICCVENEAVLEALIKAYQVAQETEEATRVAICK